MIAYIVLFFSMFFMTIATTIFGRARQRNNITYNGIGTFISGTLWFWSFRELINIGFDAYSYIFYVVAVTIASLIGQKVSMFIERKYNILADSHKYEKE